MSGVGNRIAPVRFIVFAIVAIIGAGVAIPALGWRIGIMVAFDGAAGLFILLCLPLFRHGDARTIRAQALRNDANRAMLLVLSAIVSVVILVAVAAEVGSRDALRGMGIMLIIATLALAWLFSNIVYALHYAHLFYLPDTSGADARGLAFPGDDDPDYWDFLYFAMTLGMTFQTSDVTIDTRAMRRVALAHSAAAFVFNLGIIAFTINILGQ